MDGHTDERIDGPPDGRTTTKRDQKANLSLQLRYAKIVEFS